MMRQERQRPGIRRLLVTAGALVLATVLLSCRGKSNPVASGDEKSNQPTRISGSPYPMSARPDTLFVMDESSMDYAQILTVESLQGLLAQTKPRIYMISGTNDGYTLALNYLEENYGVTADLTYESDFIGLLNHFKNYIKGYIYYATTPGDAQIDIALSMAGIKDAIVVCSADEQDVAGLGIKQVADVSGETYQQFINEYKPAMSTRVMCYQTSAGNKAQYLADYAVFGKAFFYYGDLSDPVTSQVFSDMTPNSALLGWGSDEYGLVQDASRKSIMVHAADYAKDLSVLSNFSADTKQQSHITDPKVIDSMHTVCFLMTDGDNLQWVLSNFETDPMWYASPYRGKLNLGWTVSPAMCELAPTVLKSYYDREGKSEGGRDYFVAGPSGLGYMYPEFYPNLGSYASLTAAFMKKADLTIVNVIGGSSPPNIPLSSLVPYANQSQISAVFYYPYSNYAGCGGQIAWLNGKPVITARYNLWSAQYESPQSLAAKLNNASTDITSPDGYTLVAVHVWTQSVGDVYKCVSLLSNHVRVVPPDEFVALIKENVKH